ncbi:hypothetical protein [uncultured Sphingomonas sp.]|uniref:hypothetical protein n=1 Tax=uncultured Sphingomonas sp. TaxID=158754 RepID=UPI0035C965CA
MFSRARETTGWVDTDRLALDAAASHPALSAWVGDWYMDDDHIRLTRATQGRLRVDGDAYWPGAHPADRPSGPNVGNLEGTFAVNADRLDYSNGNDSYDCRATLRLLGDYLLVEDDGNCGGMNVRFTGTYRRRPAHSPAIKS